MTTKKPPTRARKPPAKKRAGTTKPASPLHAVSDAAEPTPIESRGARKKRETRARLLDAALRLMAERGAEGVTISEITELADTALGSFYNYFSSRDAIHQALQQEIFETFADETELLLQPVEDPAAAVGFAIRTVLLRARREPLWGLFLIRESTSVRLIERGLGRRLLRDLNHGVDLGRFKVNDLLMAFTAAGGTVMAAILAERFAGDERGPFSAEIRRLGMKPGDIPERTAATVLTIFGVPAKEAEKLARLPMPMSGPAKL